MNGPLEPLRTQRDLALRLLEADGVEDVAGVLRGALARLDGVDAVGVYLRVRPGEDLRLAAHSGVSAGFAEAVHVWRDGHPAAGAPVLGGRTVEVDRTQMATDPDLAPLLEEGLRCEVLVPVTAADEVLLAAAVAGRRLDRLPDATRRTAEALAATAAQAVRRLRVEQRRREGEAEARAALELQVELATALLSSRDRPELLRRIVDGLMEVPWIDSAGVYLLDRPAGVARLTVHRGLSPQLAAVAGVVSLDVPEAVEMLRGRPRYDHPDDERYLEPLRREVAADGFVGRALVPVTAGGWVEAVLVAASRKSPECPAEVRSGLESSALHVGAAMRRLDAEEALRHSERVLRHAQSVAHLGSWRWDPRTGEMWWSDEMCRIYGVEPGQPPPGIGFLTDSVHPEDRDPDIQTIHEEAGRVVSNLFEQRIVRADGTVATLQTQLELETDRGGALTSLLGVVQDVTERRRIEAALERRLRFERATASISTELLSGREGALQRVLRELLVVSGASRVYLFENFDDPADGPCARQIAEASAPGVESQSANPLLQHCPWSGAGFERWPRLLAAGEPVCGLVEHLPEGERATLEPQGIVSLLVLPVFVAGRWWGFVGFDDTFQPRQWQDPDVLLLRTVAEMLGTFLERRRRPRG